MSPAGRPQLFLLSRLARSQQRSSVYTYHHSARTISSGNFLSKVSMIDRSQSGRGEASCAITTSVLLLSPCTAPCYVTLYLTFVPVFSGIVASVGLGGTGSPFQKLHMNLRVPTELWGAANAVAAGLTASRPDGVSVARPLHVVRGCLAGLYMSARCEHMPPGLSADQHLTCVTPCCRLLPLLRARC